MWDLTLRHRNSALRAVGAVVAALLSQGCATAGDGHGAIETDKVKQLEDARAQVRAPFQSGNLAMREVQPATLRDPGQPDAISYLCHADFRFDGGVGFLIDQLALRMVPRASGDPVWLDDVSSYTLQPVGGSAHVTTESMVALFNTVVFARRPGENPPLRGFSFSLDDGTLDMRVEMRRRGARVPIELRSPLVLRDPQTIVFYSNVIKVHGQDAGALMDAARIELANPLSVPTPAVQLTGNETVMQVPKLSPPPALELKLSATRVTRDGLLVQTGDGNPQVSPLAHAADAQCPCTLFRGGDTCFIHLIPINVRTDIVVADPAKPLVFNLYRYRDQLVARSLHSSPDGGIRVLMSSSGTLAAVKVTKVTATAKAGKPALQLIKRVVL